MARPRALIRNEILFLMTVGARLGTLKKLQGSFRSPVVTAISVLAKLDRPRKLIGIVSMLPSIIEQSPGNFQAAIFQSFPSSSVGGISHKDEKLGGDRFRKAVRG